MLSRPFFVFLIALIISSVFISLNCKTETIWGLPLEEVRTKIANTEQEFLRHIKFEEESLSEILKIGPEAPYYFFYILNDLGYKAAAMRLLELYTEQADSFWKGESVLLLLENLLKLKLYQKAENTARSYLGSNPESRQIIKIRMAFIESLYWQQKNLKAIEEIKKTFPNAIPEGLDELRLFQAVALCRAGKKEWKSYFEELFLDLDASEIHIRAYDFLEEIPERLSAFLPHIRKVLGGKYQLAKGRRERALELLEPAIREIDPEKLKGSAILIEIGHAYIYSEMYDRGVKYLIEISRGLDTQTRLVALEMAGRLSRKAGHPLKSETILREVAESTIDSKQRDRCLWYILKMRFSTSRAAGLQEIKKSILLWSDRSYFDDILEREIADLVSSNNRNALLEFYDTVNRDCSPFIQSRLAFIIQNYAGGEPAGRGAIDRKSVGFSGRQYYDLLLRYLEGDDFSYFQNMEHQLLKEKNKSEYTPLEQFVLGFFDYGLFKRGYLEVKENANNLDPMILLITAKRLIKHRAYAETVRIMELYLARKEGFPSREELKLAYPLGFRQLTDEFAHREDIPRYLLYALIREESLFDPEIGSSAGAIGLMQLMLPTAQEVATQLGMNRIDLKDPEQNLRLGSRYMGSILKRLENIPLSLMSYNAGPTRTRRWAEDLGSEDEKLVEAVPIHETRHYVRKVMVSAILYAHLYEGLKPTSVIESFYPGLKAKLDFGEN